MAEGKSPLVFSSLGLSPDNLLCPQQSDQESDAQRIRAERRTRTHPRALDAPLNQRPETITGRLAVVLVRKEYLNFILQFAFSAFLYSEIRAKFCSGLGVFKNAWRSQVSSATGGQGLSLPIITIVTAVTRPLQTILQALRPRMRTFSPYWMSSLPQSLSRPQQTKTGFAEERDE